MPRISNIELLQKAEQPTLSIRVRTKVENLPAVIQEGYGKLASYLGELGQLPAGVPFVAYHNLDMRDLEVEMGFPVPYLLPEKGDITSSCLPAGKVAFCMFRGPYGDMTPAYEDMTRWIMENGLKPVGEVYEFYYNGPEFPEDEYLTKIMMPVKQAEI